jgi:hypothetical protein
MTSRTSDTSDLVRKQGVQGRVWPIANLGIHSPKYTYPVRGFAPLFGVLSSDFRQEHRMVPPTILRQLGTEHDLPKALGCVQLRQMNSPQRKLSEWEPGLQRLPCGGDNRQCAERGDIFFYRREPVSCGEYGNCYSRESTREILGRDSGSYA